VSHILGFTFNFLHIAWGITFDEAPESTMQLCIFLLNISNVRRKGVVLEFDLLLIKEALTTYFFFVTLFKKYVL
jgi:hypothetical protein